MASRVRPQRLLPTLSDLLFVLVVCRKVYLLWCVMKLFDYLGVFSANHKTHHFILIGLADLSFTGFASTTHYDYPVRHSKDILHVVTNEDDRNATMAERAYEFQHSELRCYAQRGSWL